MMKYLGGLRFYAVSTLAGAFLCSGCMTSNLGAHAETPPKPPSVAPSIKGAPHHTLAHHPGKVSVSRHEAAGTLDIEVTFEQCKPGGFIYKNHALAVEIDHSDRSITLTGHIEYVARGISDETICAIRPKPIVFVSQNAHQDPYLIKNMSGHSGANREARVLDFRTPSRIDADARECQSKDKAEIGNISGVWFLQSDPSRPLSLAANSSVLTPDAVLPGWRGGSVPLRIKSEAPYTFNLPSFNFLTLGTVVFQSQTCARVYTPHSSEDIDFLIRQTPEGL